MLDREDLPLIENILNLHNTKLDTTFLYKILTAIKDNQDLTKDILDSFSNNQVKSKSRVLDLIQQYNFLKSDSEVIIFGSWYGSILIPGLVNQVKRITCIDMNDQVLKIAKNRLFSHYNNIEFITGDVFKKDLKRYHDTSLFINTSCEHMPPMNTFPHWPNSTNFVFTSNNMYDIEGHINCVDTIEDFKAQMPDGSIILEEDEIVDERGTRFLLAGQIVS